MNLSLTTKLSVALAAVGLGLLGAVPAGAQTTSTVPETATLTVTKTVVGDPPAGTTFTLHITCTDANEGAGSLGGDNILPVGTVYDEDIPFGISGGSKDFVFLGPSQCDVTETDDGGALSNSGPVSVDILDPILYQAEITNTFAAVTTTAPPAAAAAVQATPAFTG